MATDTNVQIRIATVSDAVSIALLGRLTFAETFAHFFKDPDDLSTYLDRTFSVKKITAGFQNPNNIFIIALVNDRPVGYAKLKLHSKTNFLKTTSIGQLQKIYVLSDFLALKIGQLLHHKIMALAHKHQLKTIWLSVLLDNRRAIRFYEKNGFTEIGVHNFSIGKEDFKFMAMAKESIPT